MKKDRPVTKERILSSVGLSFRAGILTSGFDACELAMRSGAAELLILSEDGSGKQKEKLARVAKDEDVECRTFATAEELGRAIGKDQRIAIVILDQGMGKKLLTLIDELGRIEKSAEGAE
ncbi:MAG: ribosomal L7Ae/L30e/S12e/Gadd45 family protein [Clostridiales bacterium]|jgi:ribosomal protein L7Ae-like RNA K-turn-binding protein|nr:ribosomal L7Ae/L30e/S12e/Gadd45 family protein [Clostridiales bacterium]